MKLQATLIAVALAFAGSAASAATVGSFTDLTTLATSTDPSVGPLGVGVKANFSASQDVDVVYNFSIASASDLFTYAKEFEALNTSLNPATFTLYSGTSDGTSSTGTMVGSTFSFAGGDAVTTTYSDLAAGNYYFEVTGTAVGVLGATYELDVYANTPGGPVSAVPEPANMALLLGGLGLMGFMARRRARD